MKEVKQAKRGPKPKYGKVRGKVIGLYTSPDMIKKIMKSAKEQKLTKSEFLNKVLNVYYQTGLRIC